MTLMTYYKPSMKRDFVYALKSNSVTAKNDYSRKEGSKKNESSAYYNRR